MLASHDLTSEDNFRCSRRRREGLSASVPKPLTMLRTPAGSRSSTNSSCFRIDQGVCSTGFSTTAFQVAERGRKLSYRHQDREVPWNDLFNDTERLVECGRRSRRVTADLGIRSLLIAQNACLITEVIDREQRVG